MLVLGFDYGLKHIGVAIGQAITRTANLLEAIPAKNGIPDWQKINTLIELWHPEVIIVGLPLNMDGSRQTITDKAENFAKMLQEKYTLPIHMVDERLSTKAARQQLFELGGFRALKKELVDSFSAKLIVESWLSNSSR